MPALLPIPQKTTDAWTSLREKIMGPPKEETPEWHDWFMEGFKEMAYPKHPVEAIAQGMMGLGPGITVSNFKKQIGRSIDKNLSWLSDYLNEEGATQRSLDTAVKQLGLHRENLLKSVDILDKGKLWKFFEPIKKVDVSLGADYMGRAGYSPEQRILEINASTTPGLQQIDDLLHEGVHSWQFNVEKPHTSAQIQHPELRKIYYETNPQIDTNLIDFLEKIKRPNIEYLAQPIEAQARGVAYHAAKRFLPDINTQANPFIKSWLSEQDLGFNKTIDYILNRK